MGKLFKFILIIFISSSNIHTFAEITNSKIKKIYDNDELIGYHFINKKIYNFSNQTKFAKYISSISSNSDIFVIDCKPDRKEKTLRLYVDLKKNIIVEKFDLNYNQRGYQFIIHKINIKNQNYIKSELIGTYFHSDDNELILYYNKEDIIKSTYQYVLNEKWDLNLSLEEILDYDFKNDQEYQAFYKSNKSYPLRKWSINRITGESVLSVFKPKKIEAMTSKLDYWFAIYWPLDKEYVISVSYNYGEKHKCNKTSF